MGDDTLTTWAANAAQGAMITASVAVLIFIATRLIEIWSHWRNARSMRRRIVIGLFKEVQQNLNNIKQFLDENPYPGDLRDKVRANCAFRPLMIVEETTQFYDSIAPSLPEVQSASLIALSRFYDTIRTEKAIAAAFDSPAFPTLSATGRESTVDDLWRALRDAEREGLKALYELELAYPRKWFRDFRSG